jgi:hypothetical protein
MSAYDDGGPAFPTPRYERGDVYSLGMTLRDYMATHSTQPGCAEIVQMAGLVWSQSRVWKTKDGPSIHFDDWWGSLSIEEKFDLSAKVKYAQADSMLKARQQ